MATPKITSAKIRADQTPLAHLLDQQVREGDLYEKLEEGKVRCYACGHRCVILPGLRGVCKVRYNESGVLKVPWGYVGALQCDPTEKKPFFHVVPGSDTLTFGMLGCDFHCPYCQNWLTSQTLRDSAAGVDPMLTTPEQLVALAQKQGAAMVGSSYNEPLITSEWSQAVFREAKRAGLYTAYISNGNATREVLEYIRPQTDCYKVDLKSMRDKNYRVMGGTLEHVLETVRMVHQMGFWEEIVTLTIPGFNDSDEELRDAARFIASVSPDIPWHVTAFHKDYHMQDPDDTTAAALIRGAEIGREAGLRFVYAGNLPGQVGDFEHTWCPDCGGRLVERRGYTILSRRIGADGRCPDCGALIPGVWKPPVPAGGYLVSHLNDPRRITNFR